MDVSSLIYPGSKELTGAFNVVPYDEDDMLEKTKVTREQLDEQLNPTEPGKKAKVIYNRALIFESFGELACSCYTYL